MKNLAQVCRETTHQSEEGVGSEVKGPNIDGDQVEEDFTNGGRGHPPKHLKFFLLVFSKIKKS